MKTQHDGQFAKNRMTSKLAETSHCIPIVRSQSEEEQTKIHSTAT